MLRPNSLTVAQKLLGLCLVLYILTAVVVTVGEVALVSTQARQESEHQIDSLAETLGPPIAQALWNFDTTGLKLLLQTLSSVPAVGRVKLVEQSGQTLQSGLQTELGPPKTYPLLYDHSGRREYLGFLSLEPSMSSSRSVIINLLWAAVGRTAILVALLSMVLVFVVNRSVRVPLRHLAAQITRLNPQTDNRSGLALDRGSGAELVLVTDSFNTLLNQFRTALRELGLQTAQLRTLLDTSPDLIWLKNPHGVYLTCNRRMEGLVGVSERQLVGKSEHELLDSKLADTLQALDAQAFAAGKATTSEQELVFFDGHKEFVETVMTPISNPAGQVVGILGIGRDLTERKRAEAEKQLIEAHFQQSRKMESLGNLAGGIAHDMNNVLGAIRVLASASLTNHPVGSAEYRTFEIINNATERGGKMVQSLLGFARQSPAEERELNLNAIIEEEAILLERTLLAKVRIELALEDGLPSIRGDASAISNAVMNLCINAFDAMPESGTLTLRTRNRGTTVELEVQDTGVGMPKEILERAMDPFFTTKPVGKGTGLGLSLVYAMVTAHKGRMDLHSEPGRGTVVKLVFPAVAASSPPKEVRAQTSTSERPPSFHIMLVDDDALIRSSVEETLKLLGHSVTTAPNGEQSLALVEAGLRPDLVLIDINMPGLGGHGTIPHLRQLLPTVPVLLMSGRVDQSALDLAASHSGVSLLSKPFTVRELSEKLLLVLQEI